MTKKGLKVRWIDAGKVSHLTSQSIYHGLGYAQKKETANTIVLATPEEPYICIGHFQDLEKEIDLNYCRQNSLPVIRRETGGGGVYIDSGQLFVQWIFQREDLPRKVEQRFQMFLEPIIETYKFFGIDAKIYPPNDGHVNGKKIVGTGAATIGDAEVVTGNFLFDFSTETMTRALNLPNDLFREQLRGGLEHYLTTFKKELGTVPDLRQVAQIYREKCERIFGFELTNGSFTHEEIESMNQIEKKFTEDEWLFSISSKPSAERLVKIHAGVWLGLMIHQTNNGSIEVMIRMRENKIEFIRIKTSLDERANSWHDLEQKLKGIEINERVVNDEMKSYFHQNATGKFSQKDWVEAVLKIQKEKKRVFGYA